MNVSVIGAGAWGTALAAHLAKRHQTILWVRQARYLQKLLENQCNQRYLPEIILPSALTYTSELSKALSHVSGKDDLLVLAVPVSGLREILTQIKQSHLICSNIIWVCKGFEAHSHYLPHQVVEEVLNEFNLQHIGVLSGPSFAKEVAQGLPVALTVASHSEQCYQTVIHAFHFDAMRIYSSQDLIGVEIGGAVKNVLAIAIGIADGLMLGLNARAALITRGLAEISRFGVALGGQAETFMGLSGLGDLVLTATGHLSRNRAVGIQLAQGRTLEDILNSLGHVAEGVYCAQTVFALAKKKKINMPITEKVCAILFENYSLEKAVVELLHRDARAE